MPTPCLVCRLTVPLHNHRLMHRLGLSLSKLSIFLSMTFVPNRNYPLLHAVIDFLKHLENRIASTEVKEVLRDTGHITVDSDTGLLMYTSTTNEQRHYVPILPPSSRLVVTKVLHDFPMSGHLRYKKTYHRVHTQYYWKGIGQDVKAFVRSRLPFQLREPPPPRHSGQLQLFSASQPFEEVGIDIFGPLPCTTHGNRYVVVIVDRFSR